MPIYHFESTLDHPLGDVFDWHLRPGALERLMPPFGDAEVLEREGGLADGGRVLIRVTRGPLSTKWEVRHTGYEYPILFEDEQISGPFEHWRHAHRFRSEGERRTLVTDHIDWGPLGGAIGQALGGGLIERELNRLFRFRHRRLANDLAHHSRYPGKPMTVALTGSSGLIGEALRHFLTTGGHRVLAIVRRPARSEDEVAWDPRAGTIEAAKLEGLDAVIHLAAESIAGDRWDEAKKKRIYSSRVKGTELIARTISSLARPPKTFIGASAIGYYGNRGDEVLDEDSKVGDGFLAEVAEAWELAGQRSLRRGIRCVALRFGMVLSPAGGALGKMILPFKMGVGGRLGGGRQFLSWIDLDDALGAILHALRTETLEGPVNATAPHPVTNATFTDTLGRVLGRPTLIPVPGFAVKALFGQMGDALLLQGQRVFPRKLEKTGFEFRFPGLEESLSFQLGAQEAE